MPKHRPPTHRSTANAPFSPATPFSPPSGPARRLVQGPPFRSKFLAANKTPNGFKNWALYDQFLAEQLAYFLKRLKDTPEADSNLLDRSLVFYGCSTSTTHRARNYPLILAGGREFGLKHGQFHTFDEDKYRLSDLFVTMLNAIGTETESFADSTGSLDTALLG